MTAFEINNNAASGAGTCRRTRKCRRFKLTLGYSRVWRLQRQSMSGLSHRVTSLRTVLRSLSAYQFWTSENCNEGGHAIPSSRDSLVMVVRHMERFGI